VTDAATVNCGGSVYDPTELSDAPPASSLPDGPAGAVDDVGAPAFDASPDWKVVYQSDDRVDLVRELDEPFDNGGGDIRIHESRTLERVTGAPNVPDGTWMLMSRGLVHERECASGHSAEGRIELVELNETTEQVQLRVGVRPRDGDQNCPGNPPTPFTIDLGGPLGDREIIDASVVPPRPVTVVANQ
jgi:hypothetical protein